ncbi:phosphotransferase enzyme family protein, partial [Thermodesulfobacteriota bacterium]
GRESVGGDFRVAKMIPSCHGADFLVDGQQNHWRLCSFIDQTRTLDRVDNPEQARQVGAGLGRFHRLLSDLDARTLHDTLPGFHDTPGYLALYDALLAGERRPEDLFCRRFIESRRGLAGVLEEARLSGVLPVRVMHGDPKVNNFLFARDSDRVVSLIDLDTVKAGLIHYDIGDCLRSCCNPEGEEGGDLDQVDFDMDFCRAILAGYFAKASSFLTEADYGFLYAAVHLLAFELGLRFYTDHLAGNIYFKVDDSEQNLRRALVQFRLTERIEARQTEIRALVGELR